MTSLPTRFYAEMTAAVASLDFPLECGLSNCQTSFEDATENFEDHIIDHFGQKLFKCLMCYQMFKTGIAYHLHKEHDQPYSAELYKDLRHVYQDDLIKLMKKAFRIKDEKKRRRSEPVRLNAPELASNPKEMMEKYPEPRRLFSLLRRLQNLLRLEEDEIYCKFRDCSVSLPDAEMASLESHILTHYDPEVAKCLGCSALFQNVGQTGRHTCPKVMIADLRGEHEKNLMEVARECFPAAKEIDADSLVISQKLPKDKPEEYSAKLQKLVEKVEKGETKAKCHLKPCRELVVGVAKAQVRAAERLIEEHVLGHLGSLRIIQCLLCWKKLVNTEAEIELHFRKWHTTGTEPQYQDLRAVFEIDLVETLQDCFPDREDKKLESEEEFATPTPLKKGKKRKAEESSTEETPGATPKRGRQSIKKTPGTAKKTTKTPKTPRLTKAEIQLQEEFKGLNQFVQTIKKLFAKELSCQAEGCKYSLPKTAWPHVLGKHVLSHFPQPFYKCNLCETKLKFPQQHMAIKHGISEPDPSNYEDLRPEFETEFVQMTQSCFGDDSLKSDNFEVKSSEKSDHKESSKETVTGNESPSQDEASTQRNNEPEDNEPEMSLMDKIKAKLERSKSEALTEQDSVSQEAANRSDEVSQDEKSLNQLLNQFD